MKQKMTWIALVLAAVLMLQACGGGEPKKPTNQDPTEQTEMLEDGGKKVMHFNGDSNLQEEEIYRPDGTMEYRHSYQYDEEGRVIQEHYYYPDDASAIYYIFYEYDGSGRLTRKILANGSQIPQITWDYFEDGTFDMTDRQVIDNGYSKEKYNVVTRCDANGVKQYANIHYLEDHIAYLEYNADGSGIMWRYETIDEAAKGKVKYERHFDARDQLVKAYYYNAANGALQETVEGVFDESGTLIGKVKFSDQGVLKYRMELSTDDLLLKYEQYDENNVLQIVEKLQYNDAGKPLRQENYDGNNVLQSYITYTYDESGELLQEDHYYGDGTMEYYTTYEDGYPTLHYPQ